MKPCQIDHGFVVVVLKELHSVIGEIANLPKNGGVILLHAQFPKQVVSEDSAHV